MKPSEAIKELVKKWENISPGYDNPNIEFQDDSTFISDLTALISEHYYPKEFVLWSETNYDFAPFIENGIVKWVGKSDEGQSFIYTTDELFNYWKENER